METTTVEAVLAEIHQRFVETTMAQYGRSYSEYVAKAAAALEASRLDVPRLIAALRVALPALSAATLYDEELRATVFSEIEAALRGSPTDRGEGGGG